MEPGLFTQDMLEELHSESELTNGNSSDRSLGWSIDEGNPVGRIISKNGRRGNASAWIGFTPDHGVGVAVISNIGKPSVDSIGRWLLERSVTGGYKLATEYGFAKVAPYTGVRWENERPIVQVQGQWYPLQSIDDVPIDRIMEFARQEYRDIAQKRFAEDLPELLSTMGHAPTWTVTLGLQTTDGQIEKKIRMTEQNRQMVRKP